MAGEKKRIFIADNDEVVLSSLKKLLVSAGLEVEVCSDLNQAASGNVKVLVVDDEADFREMLRFWLASNNYTAIAVSDGASAIKAIKEEAPDIVFLDLNMPVMSGAETLKNIREFNQNLPVIIISAYLEAAFLKEMAFYGFSGIFYKGGKLKKSLILLETVLRAHKKTEG